MTHTRARIRIGSVTLRLLAGMILAVSLLGATFGVGSAQGIPGLPGGYGQGDWDDGWDDDGWDDEGGWDQGGGLNPGDLCASVFPNGIISGDPVVGDIDCSTIFGGGHPSQPPSEPPTYEPPTNEPPTYEPPKDPGHDNGYDHGDKDHDYDKDHDKKDYDKKDHDYNKKDYDKKDHDYNKDYDKKDYGGGYEVTTMPSTGHGPESVSNAATAGFFGALALVLFTLAGLTYRLSGARMPRR